MQSATAAPRRLRTKLGKDGERVPTHQLRDRRQHRTSPVLANTQHWHTGYSKPYGLTYVWLCKRKNCVRQNQRHKRVRHAFSFPNQPSQRLCTITICRTRSLDTWAMTRGLMHRFSNMKHRHVSVDISTISLRNITPGRGIVPGDPAAWPQGSPDFTPLHFTRSDVCYKRRIACMHVMHSSIRNLTIQIAQAMP